MMTNNIHNYDALIDSRDVIERIAYLEEELSVEPALDRPELDEAQQELDALLALAKEASAYATDWDYGKTLIHNSYFKEYAKQLAYDIGAIDPGAGWPCSCIDWDEAARELQMDYAEVDFDGVTYWIR